MRHRVAGRQLSITTAHRKAMLRNLAAGLFEHGQITTTMPKAKAVQPFVEHLITLARSKTLASRRNITKQLTDRRLFAWVADPNTKEASKKSDFWELPAADAVKFNRYGELKKSPRLVQHLMTKVAPLFDGRPGGYTRIVKLDKRRLGDATDLVVLQLVGRESGSQIGGAASRRRKAADKRTTHAAKVRKAAEATKAE